MLRNDLFSIEQLECKDNVLRAFISLEAEHPVFKGHFPGNPVTPGVVQIQIVKELLEVHFDKKLYLDSIGRCKFLSVLNPNENRRLEVKITIKNAENSLDVNASGQNSQATFFKFNASYRFQ